jgi:nucleotide-binding universal stress UspA family protein
VSDQGGIVCGVDFSEPSRVALRQAVAMAKRLGERLTLVHVFQAPVYPLPEGVLLPTPRELVDLNERVDRALAEWKAEAERMGATQVTAVALQGAPWRALVDYASEQGSALIVVGTHGHTGIRHLLLGSVAERVVRLAACPVLTVRAPEPAQ